MGNRKRSSGDGDSLRHVPTSADAGADAGVSGGGGATVTPFEERITKLLYYVHLVDSSIPRAVLEALSEEQAVEVEVWVAGQLDVLENVVDHADAPPRPGFLPAPEGLRGPEDLTANTPPPRHEEWHVTVSGDTDPLEWHTFCRTIGVKPLYIELSNYRTQLMLAAAEDVSAQVRAAGFTCARVKHEVSELRDGEKPFYYECHIKFQGGAFRPDRPGTSRDLYRTTRQYMTKREIAPFEVPAFIARARTMIKHSEIAGVEYEICVLDTNPGLDAGWLS